MSRPLVLGCVLLAACEPVLLAADTEGARGVSTQPTSINRMADAGTARDARTGGEPGSSSSGSSAPASANGPSVDAPKVSLTVKSTDCGSCFDLSAQGTSGVPPYRYEWDDGSSAETRRVCAGSGALQVWVVAEDSTSARSDPQSANLQTDAGDAGACTASVTQSPMCLMNPSFEGTAAINTGDVFDALPWSDCFDPATGAVSNTPDIASNTLDPATGIAPEPRDGTTYLALATGEHASQQLCEALTARSKTSLLLDITRMNFGSPDMFLQIWGGVSSNCSQRQLLWVSPPLNTTWTNYCVTLEPREFMDQISLRAETPTPDLVVNFLAVDNIVPVDQCP